MKYPAKNPAKFLKPEPEPEPDIEAGYPAGSGFSRISGRFLIHIPPASNLQLLLYKDGMFNSLPIHIPPASNLQLLLYKDGMFNS